MGSVGAGVRVRGAHVRDRAARGKPAAASGVTGHSGQTYEPVVLSKWDRGPGDRGIVGTPAGLLHHELHGRGLRPGGDISAAGRVPQNVLAEPGGRGVRVPDSRSRAVGWQPREALRRDYGGHRDGEVDVDRGREGRAGNIRRVGELVYLPRNTR